MSLCHFHQYQRPTPVAVVTDTRGVILLNTHIPDLVYNVNKEEYGNWAVSGSRIMITRFWAASTAAIALVPNTPIEKSSGLPLPEGIGLERDICIWMGYINRPRLVTPDDLQAGYLTRCFVGIIENIKSTVSASGGQTVMLQCRDLIKWLLDSSVYLTASELIRAEKALTRAQLILAIANNAVGAVGGEDNIGGTGVTRFFRRNPDYFVDINNLITPDAPTGGSPTITANQWYKDGPLGGTVKTRMEAFDNNLNPEFRIATTRYLTLADNKDVLNFVLTGQVPLDTIRALSFQEVYPTEVFCDNRSGHIYYAPRGNDTAGLSDPARFFRTYYCNIDPLENDILTPNQKLIAFRKEESSIGLKTNFLVSRKAPNTGEMHDDYMLHLETQPEILRDVQFARKFHKVVDPTIKGITEAGIVAVHMARIWGREVKAGMAIAIGDPSFVPGEVVQVAGSPIDAFGGLRQAAVDRENYFNYDRAWDSKLQEYAQLALNSAQNPKTDTGNPITLMDGSTVTPIPDIEQNTTSADQVAHLLGAGKTIHQGTGGPGFNQLPDSIYRIEAVVHKFNLGGQGFTSELALISPF